MSALDRSLAFYRGLLGPLGYVRDSEIAGERGERVYLNRVGGEGAVSLRECQSDAHAVPYERYAVFFYDPDGIKLELLHRPAERDLAARLEKPSRRVAQLEDEAG